MGTQRHYKKKSPTSLPDWIQNSAKPANVDWRKQTTAMLSMTQEEK